MLEYFMMKIFKRMIKKMVEYEYIAISVQFCYNFQLVM